MPAAKSKFLSKTIKFGKKNLTLYSLDGATWSSRKDELVIIQDRHEAERLKLSQIKGEAEAIEEPKAAGETEKPETEETPVQNDDDTVENVSTEGEETGEKSAGAKKASKPAKGKVISPAKPKKKAA